MATPAELAAQGACFQCYGASSAQILKLALLDTISGGGTGTCVNLEGPEADPTGIYTPTFIGQVYVTTGHVWQATGLTSADWTEICTDTNPAIHTFFDVTIDGFFMSGFVGLTEVNFPNLTDVLGAVADGVLSVSNNPSMTTLSAPLLETVNLGISFGDSPNLTSVDLSSLQTIGADLYFAGSTGLASLSLPSLVTVGGNVIGTSNTALVTFSAPLWVPTDGSTIDFIDCALSVASVELILSRCVAAAVTTCTINLNGGTNAGLASLSVQGQNDHGTLVVAGNTVAINP